MRGRRPKPDSMTQDGTVPSLKGDELPDPPDWILPQAILMYRDLGPVLADKGLLHDHTLESFVQMCQCYALWQKATEEVNQNGITLNNGRGMTRLNPAAAFANEQQKQFRSWAGEFGLTPGTRARAGATDAGTSAADEFLDMPLENR